MNGTSGATAKVNKLSQIATIEEALAASLSLTAGQVARSECFDAEQRAEVYAILDSMRADAEQHRESVGRWINDRTGEAYDV